MRFKFREPKEETASQPPVAPPPSPLAMRLALAYFVEQCVEDGTIESYADAARRLGITRARMTQVMDLVLLLPVEKERILAGS